jgi:diguanylate cyclase (GGDEF)-like protein
VSPLLSSIVTAAAGILSAGAVAGMLLWRQHRLLVRARYAADHDDTTGLPNRRALLAALARVLPTGRPVGVVLLDLDQFKPINDTFGHEAGNQVLAEIGARLAALGPPVRMAARLSGDEFALLVEGGPGAVSAAAYAAWHAVRRRPVGLGDRPVTMRASVGHATATLGISPRLLLHHADLAMYQAKQSGGGVRPAAPTPPGDLPPGVRYRDLPRP